MDFKRIRQLGLDLLCDVAVASAASDSLMANQLGVGEFAVRFQTLSARRDPD
jgi:hypothetical protein